MNTIFKRLLIIAFTLISTLSLDAVFTRVVRYTFTAPDGVVRNVFMFSDIHIDYVYKPKRFNQIYALLAQAKKMNAFVIAEDMYTYTGDNPHVKNFQLLNAKTQHDEETAHQNLKKRGINSADYYKAKGRDVSLVMDRTPLNQLITRCQREGIGCCNIETRYLTTASECGSPITSKQLFQSAQSSLKALELEYEKCNDAKDPQAVTLYNNFRKVVNNSSSGVCGSAQICLQRAISNYETLNEIKIKDEHAYNDFFWYESNTIDLKILLEFFKNRTNRNIFICVGQIHSNELEPVLGLLDYHLNGECGRQFDDDTGNDEEIVASTVDIEQFFVKIKADVKAQYLKCRDALAKSKEQLNLLLEEQATMQKNSSLSADEVAKRTVDLESRRKKLQAEIERYRTQGLALHANFSSLVPVIHESGGQAQRAAARVQTAAAGTTAKS